MANEQKKPSYKIFLVDDDKFLLDMYSIKFSEEGFEVITASDGEEALDKIASGVSADVYLVDLLLPKTDGFKVIEDLKARGIDKHAALIILSNLGQQADIDRGLKAGVDGYIVKATATPSEVVAKTVDITSAKLSKN